ncbi:carbohydrate ABC transporter permease [Clostridium thermosuccinogenes]|uniref:carbohydrate ABC transporter permease n=1 Tax=Clostridium thermosuccinogenes TaxID=84032 RepID=UPI000CCBE8C1|nr:carbohydrate ABC transporter permease [Pseudoclostridium thermosuccinogenes]PNT93470.1 hypothetical protein CDQ83_08200 [Pseudoclostridium thermosuccinogenes]
MTNMAGLQQKHVAVGEKLNTKKSMTRITRAKVEKSVKKTIFVVFRYALIISLSYMILYPLLRMIAQSFTHPYDIGSMGSIWVPEMPVFDNIIVASTIMNYPKGVVFTTLSTLVVVVLQTFNAAFAGYSFARLKFRGSKLLFALVIFTIVVPPSSVMLPQYVYLRNFDILGIFQLITGHKLNLLGKPASMWLLAALGQGLNSGLFVYIFRQFFKGLPKELEEAAYVDGAGLLRIFLRIVLPISKPGILTVGVLSFVWNWNDTYFPRLFNPTNDYLRIRLSGLSAASGGTSNVQLAIGNVVSKLPPDILKLTSDAYDKMILTVCSLLIILPLIVFFLIVQKHFVEGIERSGIVG